MNNKEAKRENLLRALWAVALLAPALRNLPGENVKLAGSSGWLSPVAAVPFILLYMWFIHSFSKKRRSRETLPAFIDRCAGKIFGKLVSVFLVLWCVFYAGFLLRFGAERFTSMVYITADPAFFIITLAILSFFGAVSPPRQLARCAKVFAPLVFGILLLTLLLSLPGWDVSSLLPVTIADAPRVLLGSVPVINVFVSAVCAAFVFSSGARREAVGGREYAGPSLLICLILTLLTALTLSIFGDTVTSRLSYPYFSLVRNINIGTTLERLDAFAVVVWIMPDFILCSALLSSATRIAAGLFGYEPVDAALDRIPREQRPPRSVLKNGRYFSLIVTAAAAAFAFLVTKGSFTLERLSTVTVPIINLSLAFVLIPMLFILGKARSKI